MNLILRLLISLGLLVVRILLRLAVAAFLWLLLPLVVLVFGLLRSLFLLSLTAAVNGPTRFINRLAGEWTERFHERVDNREHIHQIYQLCRFLVGTLIVLGWLVATLFTIVILRVVFGNFI